MFRKLVLNGIPIVLAITEYTDAIQALKQFGLSTDPFVTLVGLYLGRRLPRPHFLLRCAVASGSYQREFRAVQTSLIVVALHDHISHAQQMGLQVYHVASKAEIRSACRAGVAQIVKPRLIMNLHQNLERQDNVGGMGIRQLRPRLKERPFVTLNVDFEQVNAFVAQRTLHFQQRPGFATLSSAFTGRRSVFMT